MSKSLRNTNEITHETVVTYVRVSTEDQDPDTHRNEVNEFVEQEYPGAHQEEFADIWTGTTTIGREQFGQLKDKIQEEDIDAVVTTSVSRVARSIRDLSNFIDLCEQRGTAVHFTRESLDFEPTEEDPYNRAMLQMLGIFAELEAKITQQRTKETIRQMRANGHKWGRAPFGFEKENGNLYPKEDFDRICSVLELVDDGELSQNKAASMLDTSRTTIRRAITEQDRRDLYDLPMES